MAKILEIQNTKQLSLDFIAGLIAGEGYFGWVNQSGQKLAVFQLQMHFDDRELVFAVRNSLGLKEPVYEYNYQDRNKSALYRHCAKLLVRRREVIDKIIIPAFEGRLYGLKKMQFDKWKEQFFQEKKKWRYRYTERIPRLIQLIQSSPKNSELTKF